MGQRLPRGVWAIGFVSLLMDVSSEMIHALLPVFLVGTLGASAVVVGLIEGIAEAAALMVKLVSGAISDWAGRRKFLAVIGYGMSAITKPMFALATTASMVFAARFTDRIGKGIRGAPRDALVADITPVQMRGRAYGLRQGLDTLGAVLGPLLAAVFMLAWADVRLVFWIAAIPAVAAVALLIAGVREPARPAGRAPVRPFRRDQLRMLPVAFWVVTGIAAFLAIARFSEAFLVLRGSDVGMSAAAVPLVFVVMNAVAAAASYPAGAVADRGGQFGLLVAGVLALVASQVVLAIADGWAAVLAGAALWGVQLGLTQGLFAALVSLTAPASLRGTAFGLFNVVSGLMMLVGSILAGVLWEVSGPATTFVVGAAVSCVAVAGLIVARPLLRL